MKKISFFLLFIFILVSTVNTYASEENEGVVSSKIYSYNVVQDSEGNLKYTFYKSNDLLYSENTIFDIDELGIYNIQSDKTITIPFNLLTAQERYLNIRVKEEEKDYSEVTEIYVFSYQTDFHASNLTDIFNYYQMKLKETYNFNYIEDIQLFQSQIKNYLELFIKEIKETDELFEVIGLKGTYQKEMNDAIKRMELLNENNYQRHNLNEYILNNTTIIDDELQIIIDESLLTLSNNSEIESAVDLLNQALVNIDEYLSTKVTLVRQQVKDEFILYIGSNLNSDTLNIINKNITTINSNNYNIFLEVEIIRETLKIELDRYVLELQIEETILEITTYVTELTTSIDLELYNIITNYNQLLYDAISYDNLIEIKESALAEINNYLDQKVSLIQDQFVDFITNNQIITDQNILDIISNHKLKITTKNYNVDGYLDELILLTNEAIYQYNLTIYKTEIISNLNQYIDINFYKYKDVEKILIDQLINMINDRETEYSVDEAYKNAVNEIDLKITQYYNLKLNELRNELLDYASNYQVNLTKLIDDELKKIDKINHMDDDFINVFLLDTKQLIDQNIIYALKEKYIIDLESKLSTVSDLFNVIKDEILIEINDLINKQITIDDVNNVYQNLNLKVMNLINKEVVINKFINDFSVYKNKDKYTLNKLALLEDIYQNKLTVLVQTDNEFLSQKIEEIFLEFDKIPILEIKNSDYSLYDKVTNPNYQGVIQNEMGIYKNSKLNIKLISLAFYQQNLNDLLKKNGYKNHNILSGLDIGIENEKNINGVYKVALAIPSNIKQYKVLYIVYYENQNLEVIETKLIDDWLIFETTHFSNYFIVSFNKENKTLGIIIYLLSFILLLEIAYLFYKKNKDIIYKLNSFNLFFFIISSSLGIPIIIMLSILILIFLAIIIYEHSETRYKVLIKKEIIQNDIYIDSFEEKEGAIYNYSFLARLIQAPIESQKRYSDLKNYILSYPHVKILKSFKYERYMYKNKPVLKLWIHGNNLKVYYNLAVDKVDKEKYIIEDLSGVKKHESTPILYTIKGPRNLKYAYELIDLYFEFLEVKENRPYKDYTKKYLDKKTLIARDLIRVKYGKIKNKE